MPFFTLSQYNQLLDIKFHNDVIYIFGIIHGPLINRSTIFQGYIIGTLPTVFRPEKKLFFMTYNDKIVRIDIVPEGHIVVICDFGNISSINLTGIKYSINPGSQLSLKN